jgi:hypothetical protein
MGIMLSGMVPIVVEVKVAEIIRMADVRPIPPKVVSSIHMHQRYTCTFDPNAPPHARWAWEVNFVRSFKYFGTAPSLPLADRHARKRIQQLLDRVVKQEEAE